MSFFLRVRSIVCVAMLLVVVGCRRGAPVDGAAREYLRLAVALSERDPDALDFYVGPKDLEAEVRRAPPTLVAIGEQAAGLDARLAEMEAGPRVAFLRVQVRAISYRVRMLQGKPGAFDAESDALFGVRMTPDGEAGRRAEVRAQIAAEIGAGAHAYTVFDSRFVVPPERVPAVFDAALGACRAETVKHIALPAGEGVRVEYVAHKPWSAFSRYLGGGQSLIQVNTDYALTVDRILDLACHEGYPGHHVFNMLREASLVKGKGETEWAAQLTFSPQSWVSEGAASYAPEMAFSEAERVRVEREVLFPEAGLDAAGVGQYVRVEGMVKALHTAEPGIAREYLEGRLEFVRAAEALEREALMEHAETALLYLNEYRSYGLTYTQGRDGVAGWVEAGDRWGLYGGLMREAVVAVP
jgi:hypothetical protein